MKFDPPILNLTPAQRHLPDPSHCEHDLWLGVDSATTHLGFTLEDIVFLFRRNRRCAISMLSRLGSMLVDRQPKPGEFWALLRDPADGERFNAAVGNLRGWLSELKESRA